MFKSSKAPYMVDRNTSQVLQIGWHLPAPKSSSRWWRRNVPVGFLWSKLFWKLTAILWKLTTLKGTFKRKSTTQFSGTMFSRSGVLMISMAKITLIKLKYQTNVTVRESTLYDTKQSETSIHQTLKHPGRKDKHHPYFHTNSQTILRNSLP